MDEFRPSIIKSLKKYNKKSFRKDVFAGLMVAIIALPLSIALAISSGASPEQGLYSAIIGGLAVSLLSGSRVQVGGVTAATAITISTIIGKYGLTGLAVASVMAGFMLIIMGIFRFGSLLKYIPVTITTGFTVGIGFGIFTSQIKDFLGLSIESMPITIVEKWSAYAKAIHTFDITACIFGIASILFLIIWTKLFKKIPSSLAMISVMTIIAWIFKIPVQTIKSSYGELSSKLPTFRIPKFDYVMIQELFSLSLTLAILIAIVSLLSCVVTDGLTGKRHNSNMELVAQGAANILCGLFGALPVAGAVARSTISIRSGGKSQVAGIVHSVIICGILLFLMPIVEYIPMASLSALLIVVSYNMINWKEIHYAIKHAPKADAIVLFVTMCLAIFVNLMTAVQFGLLLAALLFMKRMANVTTVHGWRFLNEENENDEKEKTQYFDFENIDLKVIPKNTQVYELCGPLFFAASDKIRNIAPNAKSNCLILRMRSVNFIDVTAMHRLEHLLEECKKHNITLVLSHVNEQPMSIIRKSGFLAQIGEENICKHIDEALLRAEQLNQ